jgi:hypothetical protein
MRETVSISSSALSVETVSKSSSALSVSKGNINPLVVHEAGAVFLQD